MSSILEALRELEGDKARASGKKVTSVVDAPREPERQPTTHEAGRRTTA